MYICHNCKLYVLKQTTYNKCPVCYESDKKKFYKLDITSENKKEFIKVWKELKKNKYVGIQYGIPCLNKEVYKKVFPIMLHFK